MAKPTLIGNDLRLRDFIPTDVRDRLALGQTPDILRMFGGTSSNSGQLRQGTVTEWMSGLAKQPFAWAIEHAERWIGEIRLDALDEHDRRAKLAVGLYDPKLLGRGLGRQAITVLLDHAFTTMNLHRVSLRVLAYNTRAIRCYAACGFVEEGREREAALVEGNWYDDVIMGILADEFLALRGRTDVPNL